MSIAQLFFRKGNYIENIELDVVISESATATARMTENPVENGANVNDHIIIDPMTFAMSGIVSNISSNIIGAVTGAFNPGRSKSKETWEALLELHAKREPFKLVQGLREYDNVVLLTISEQQDKDTANGLFFNATFRQLNLVGAEPVTADRFSDSDTYDKMHPAASGGVKPLNTAV